MAPMEPDTSNSNLYFLLGSAGSVVFVTGLVASVGRVLYRAYSFLPPSQAVRVRQSDRRKHVQIFLALSVLSFAVAIYHSVNFAIVSYDVWATERGVKIPKALWGEDGVIGGGDANVPLQLGWWTRDTSLCVESWEIATERSRRFWWTQQALLSGTSWSVYLGLEGIAPPPVHPQRVLTQFQEHVGISLIFGLLCSSLSSFLWPSHRIYSALQSS
jgi:hypothetical protein